METVKTASGKTFECVAFSVVPALNRCYVTIANSTLSEIVTVFSDPNETAHIVYEGTEVDGYHVLMAIIPEGEYIRINLRREYK